MHSGTSNLSDMLLLTASARACQEARNVPRPASYDSGVADCSCSQRRRYDNTHRIRDVPRPKTYENGASDHLQRRGEYNTRGVRDSSSTESYEGDAGSIPQERTSLKAPSIASRSTRSTYVAAPFFPTALEKLRDRI
ncbi:Uu.00g120050.m01.CDS01 [Anthostomella pinea]|uniref:Uu.00g120050.m01.CDS01 n=1 Tax=Anthostomella pinea TaxID=933095 RepID=A0AAI8VH89_9PEZI|nr:Uu.00g120050.m01.CDS01 [Anthostomella pinea]